MALLHVTSPHAHSAINTRRVMSEVCLAAIPGTIVLSFFFGAGIWVHVLAAMGLALGLEAIMLLWRHRPIRPAITDCSALVTGLLLGIALPPTAPWWILVIGMVAAIMVAKHLYGGLGHNPMNPAMVGYVVLLIAFPVEMTRWLPPQSVFQDSGADAAVLH
ncbi:MAG: RnfABCDGE type electron transport complex subunit D, partial [Gammaproteobacteria bacterium]